MAVLFVLLFFAAIIGIVRPYKFIPQGKRWHYGVAALGAFVLIGLTAPQTPKTSPHNGPSVDAGVAPAESQQASLKVPASEAPASKWTYNETKDEMREAVRRTAEVESENSIDLDFPYGEQRGLLTVRQDPQFGLDVMFRVRSGQILCHGFGDSYINAKFDDGPIKRFNCVGASDGTSDVAFVEGARTFLAALKKADRAVIEAEFYQNGRQQFVFDIKNLKWECVHGHCSERSE